MFTYGWPSAARALGSGALDSVLRSKQDDLLVGTIDLDALRLDIRIVFEGVMDDAPIKSVERLEFDHVSPTPDFLGGILGFANQRVSSLGSITTDINRDFGRARILFEEESIEKVLEVAQRLALAADEAAGILALHFQKRRAIQIVLYDGGFEAEEAEEFFKLGFGLDGHMDQRAELLRLLRDSGSRCRFRGLVGLGQLHLGDT